MRAYTTFLTPHILQLLEKLCSLSGAKPCYQANHAVRLTQHFGACCCYGQLDVA